MITRTACIALVLALAACRDAQRSDLSIVKVVPPTFTPASGTAGPSCTFDPNADEFSYLPVNLAENLGNVAAVVSNNILDPSTLNSQLRLDTATFLPHQAVVTYEVIGTGTAPTGANIIPVSGSEIPSAGKGTVAVPVFAGAALTASAGSYIRATFHIEGKLQDGSKVSTSEREYVFVVCATAGCGQAGSWGTCL